MSPFRLRGWQQDIIKAMYPPTGKRPRQGLVSMPRGNGKTSLAAALALYALLADDEPSAQVRSEEHTSELQSRGHLVCRLLLEKKNTKPLQKIDIQPHIQI